MVDPVPLVGDVHGVRREHVVEADVIHPHGNGQVLQFAMAVGDTHRTNVVPFGKEQFQDELAVVGDDVRLSHALFAVSFTVLVYTGFALKFPEAWWSRLATFGEPLVDLRGSVHRIAALVMLNLMENFPVAKFGHNSADALHAMIESKNLAYADMLRFVADPNLSRVPVAGMLSKDYARERAKLIDPTRANCKVNPGTPPGSGWRASATGSTATWRPTTSSR